MRPGLRLAGCRLRSLGVAPAVASQGGGSHRDYLWRVREEGMGQTTANTDVGIVQ